MGRNFYSFFALLSKSNQAANACTSASWFSLVAACVASGAAGTPRFGYELWNFAWNDSQ